MKERMDGRKATYMGAICYEFGKFFTVSECDGSQEAKEQLIRQGFFHYSDILEDIDRVIAASCEKTMSSRSLSPSDICSVVVASNAYSYYSLVEARIQSALHQLGFIHQPVIGVNYSLCANFSSALRVARMVLHEEQSGSVLVIVADVFPSSYNRVAPGNMHLMSDCVSSCIVSSSPDEYEILSIAQCGLYDHHATARSKAVVDPLGRIQKMAGALTRVKSNLLDRCGLDVASLETVIFENYNSSTTEFAAKVLGIERSKITFEGRREHGHAAASDVLVSLCLAAEAGKCGEGVPLALLSVSPTTAALVALEYLGIGGRHA